MLYVFNNSQKLLKAYGDDAFIEMHLEEAINSADELTFSLPKELKLPDDAMYVAVPYPNQIEKYSFLMLGDVFNKAETVEYQASEMAYTELATYKYIKDVRPQKRTPGELVSIAISGTPWSLAKCNVDGSYSTNFYYISPFEALQKILELAKGEISFYITIEGNKITGRYIEYLNQQGSDNGYRFEYGNNLVDVSKEANLGTIYTAIVPRGKGELIEDENPDTPDGYGRRITIANVAWSKSKGNPLDKPLKSEVLIDPNAKAKFGQLDGTNRYLVEVFEDIEEPEQLIKAAYRRLNEINHIQVEYQAQVVDGHQLNLGDTVVVKRNDNRDLDFKTRVFKIKYDLLSPKNAQLSLGDNMSGQSLESKIKSISSSSSSANDKSLWAMQNGDGTRTFYSDKKPVSAKEGDLWFKELPNGDVEVYRYEKGEWVLVLDPATGERIQNEVNDALQKAKEYSEQLNQKTNENIGELEKTVNSGLAEIQPKIDAAKKDAIDTSQQKVDALNQQVTKDLQTVQPRIDKAKQEAMQDASQKISKVEIKTDSITSIVNNPSTGLSATRVQLDNAIQQEIKDRKTGDTNTLTQSKNFTTSQIENSEKGLKSTINQTADGIMANVGRQNLIVDSSLIEKMSWWKSGNWKGNPNTAKNGWYWAGLTLDQGIYSLGINNTNEDAGYAFVVSQPINVANKSKQLYANVDVRVQKIGAESSDYLIVYVVFVGQTGNMLAQFNLTGTYQRTTDGKWESHAKNIEIPEGATKAYMQYQLRGNANAYVSRPYIGFGPLDVGNYIPGPVSNSNTTLALFDDRITSTVTGLEGKISNVTQKADSIASVVNNPTTGLSATRTQLDSAIQQEIKDRKSGDTNTLTQSKDFTTSQIKSSESGLKSTISQTADGIMLDVSKANLVIDSSLTEGVKWWTTTNFKGSKGSAKDWYYSAATRYKSIPSIGINNTGEGNKYAFITSQPIDVRAITTIYANVDIFVRSMGTTSNDYLIVYVVFMDKNGNQVGDYSSGSLAGTITKPQPWTSYTKSFTVPSGAVNAYIQYQLRGNANAYVSRPYIGFGPLELGRYIPGPVSNTDTFLSLFNENFGLG
ncbi:phage tail spike protein, partial [Weissella minor]|uniref:phage tail spike protein n=2 Tax=Weissella minor TaxID=1620 RepID=UPI0012EE73CD